MRTYKPKNFIKVTEKTQQYECAICNYIAEKPYTCNGPCKQMFCFQCMNCIRKNNNECPFRCSKPFELKQCQEVQLEFRCPFNPEKCEDGIPSISKFYNHNDCCKFTPPNWKDREENFSKYRCEKGHNLFFLDEADLMKLYSGAGGYYDQPMNSICSLCKDKGLCRTICPECSTKEDYILYCTSCRKPPCTRGTCLYSHPLKQIIAYSESIYCDFCGTSAQLLGPKVYNDQHCNFDICEVCYVNLPETHELVPFKMNKNVIDHLINKDKKYISNSSRIQQILETLQNMRQMNSQNNLPEVVQAEEDFDEEEAVQPEIINEEPNEPQHNIEEQEQEHSEE